MVHDAFVSFSENDSVYQYSHNVFVLADLKEVITEEKPVPLVPGSLVAEPYSWKSLVTGQPCVRIRSTGTKCAVMCLPAGYVDLMQPIM